MSTTLSPDGDVKDVFDFPMNEEGYRAFAERVPKDARIGFEATGMAYPVYRRLRELGYEDITVAHPKELKWITKSKKKNDHVDTLKIAKLLMVGMLPESHLLSREGADQEGPARAEGQVGGGNWLHEDLDHRVPEEGGGIRIPTTGFR
ncbi:MAG: hypothetical protein JRN61_03375 [Nitrososphaerota archaeon]|nr:hypothetical protein [Nitrososphaerota archaeon]